MLYKAPNFNLFFFFLLKLRVVCAPIQIALEVRSVSDATPTTFLGEIIEELMHGILVARLFGKVVMIVNAANLRLTSVSRKKSRPVFILQAPLIMGNSNLKAIMWLAKPSVWGSLALTPN